MKEAVGKRTADAFMEEDEHEADLDAFVSETIGVVMTIAHDQSPRLHLSEIIPELGDRVVVCGQSVACEDSCVKRSGEKPRIWPAAWRRTSMRRTMRVS
jgi:hypothetical protein